MLMFTPAISCLTTPNLPQFMDLTFQVPMQYCYLQHWSFFLSPVTPTTGYCFCFGSIPSFFLELFLHWSPVAYWAPTDLESTSFSILSFCCFILFMGFSKQEYWSGLPFPSPVDYILSPCFCTMTHPSWVTHMAWLSFIELDKAVVSLIRLTIFLWLWFVYLLSDASSNTYHLTWGLLPWTWGISSQLLQQSTATAPYLGRRVSSYHLPTSWSWTWGGSSQPSSLVVVL